MQPTWSIIAQLSKSQACQYTQVFQVQKTKQEKSRTSTVLLHLKTILHFLTGASVTTPKERVSSLLVWTAFMYLKEKDFIYFLNGIN